MGNSAEYLRQTMRAKTDDELYLLLHVHSQDYTLQALAVANEELSRRQLREPTARREKMLNRTTAVADTALEDGELGGAVAEGSVQTITSMGRRLTTIGEGLSVVWKIVKFCASTLALIGLAYGLYIWMDESGWIEHDHDTPIWIKGEWLVAEYRVCQIPLVPEQPLPDSAHLLCGQSEVLMEEDLWSPDFIRGLSDLEFAELAAGRWSALDQYFHVLPVHYWGRIDRSDRKMFSWRCQRNSDSLTCRALD